MDLVEERADLADDIIHHIFSFLDMKYAVQTCTLSKKWRNIWTSMPNINLNSFTFPTLPQFCDFVEHALSHRNNGAEVSAVNLTFAGFPRECVVESIVKYAYLHNVKKLNLTFLTDYDCRFSQQFFSSHTLKHLSLQVDRGYNDYCVIQNLAWDFPVLETLIMKDIVLSYVTNKNLNLFSKCVNLKELTLDGCSAYNIFNICAPQLSSLTITGIARFTTVFNVVASHLQNLTLTINSISRLDFLEMSPEGLNKVNLSLSLCGYTNEIYQSVLLDLLPKLHGAKYLILDGGIIEALSSCWKQLSHESCPFHNLKCLKINTMDVKQKERIAIAIQVKNYFLENSPNATFIMDLPKDQLIAEQKAKIQMQDKLIAEQTAKLQMKDGVIADQNAKLKMLEVTMLQNEKLMSEIIKCKIAELKVQVESGNPDYEAIRLIGRDIKSAMELVPEILRAVMVSQFLFQYVELKSQLLNRIDASKWAHIDTELGSIRD